jgi:hypothetical protein
MVRSAATLMQTKDIVAQTRGGFVARVDVAQKLFPSDVTLQREIAVMQMEIAKKG